MHCNIIDIEDAETNCVKSPTQFENLYFSVLPFDWFQAKSINNFLLAEIKILSFSVSFCSSLYHFLCL